MQLKKQSDSWYLEVGLKQLSNQRKQRFKSERFASSRAWEIRSFKRRSRKQVVQEFLRGLKAAQERAWLLLKTGLSDFIMYLELLVKAQSALSAAVANLEKIKRKIRSRIHYFNLITVSWNCWISIWRSSVTIQLFRSADMPMDIRSSNPTTFSGRPTVLPTGTISPQVAPKATQLQNKSRRRNQTQRNSRCSKCRFFQYAAATMVLSGYLLDCLLKKKKQSSKWLRHT